MARRKTSGRRRGRPRTSNGTNGSPKALLSQLTDLVEQNEALTRENRELQSIVSRVSDAVGRLSPGRGRAVRLVVMRPCIDRKRAPRHALSLDFPPPAVRSNSVDLTPFRLARFETPG